MNFDMISIWFRYDFVMISLWQILWFSYGFGLSLIFWYDFVMVSGGCRLRGLICFAVCSAGSCLWMGIRSNQWEHWAFGGGKLSSGTLPGQRRFCFQALAAPKKLSDRLSRVSPPLGVWRRAEPFQRIRVRFLKK